MLGHFLDWAAETVAFFVKTLVFLGVLMVLLGGGAIHAAIYGGPVMPDDMWFLAKIVFLLFLPLALAITFKKWSAFALGAAASVLLAFMLPWGAYAHAPQFWESKPYSVENGKLVIPEGNRELLMRDCGHIGHPGMKDSCRVIVYCQSYDAAAYGRMGCEELLTKKTSPALLDLALQERRGFEQK